MAMGRRPNEKARKIVQSILGVSPTLRDKNYSSDKEEPKERKTRDEPNYFGKG